MQYFAQDFFEEVEYGSEEDKKQSQLWMEAHEKYRTYLKTIQNKLSKKLFIIIEQNKLHDSKFIRMEMENKGRGNIPINFNLYFEGEKVYCIRYQGVRKYTSSFIASEHLNHLGFGDCIITELLSTEEDFFSHELLFSTGARIYIE